MDRWQYNAVVSLTGGPDGLDASFLCRSLSRPSCRLRLWLLLLLLLLLLLNDDCVAAPSAVAIVVVVVVVIHSFAMRQEVRVVLRSLRGILDG